MRTFVALALTVAASWAAVAPLAAAPPPETPPDLTVDRGVSRELTYNLGATGMRGWIHTRAATMFDSAQGRTTTASRQILVTHVGKGSPADGVMQVDDVILGVDGTPFAEDSRRAIARAIQEAEKEENAGRLRLVVWRAGKTLDLELKLPVLGTYSDTAPYDCPKSERIFAAACKVLEQEPLKDDLWGAVNGLALLATGRDEYLPRLRELARKIGPPSLTFGRNARGTWTTGYQGVFLSEYYLVTHDEDVMPALREFTLALARGQSMYGTFGHGFAEPRPDGGLHGSIPPYGPVNAAGLVANLAIVLGRRCGVADPEVDRAVERAAKFLAYYVDKGAIPYGEHLPWPYHDNNGKNAMAALFFGVHGDSPPEARFFAKMVTASFKNREYGHTGQGFSYLWGGLGANVGGPAAAAAFFREASCHLDLVRRCDGSFTYDGGEQYGPGKTDDDTYYGRSSYYGLSPTATYVLTYSLPLRKILLTGREPQPAHRLSAEDVREAVAAGHFDLDRKGMDVDGLMTSLGDWSPIVRGWAAEELARRPEARGLVPQLLAMAEGNDPRRRQGSCEALGHLQAEAAVPVLVRLLAHEDRWLRVKAAEAIKRLGAAAKPAVPDMLRVVADTAEASEPIPWVDPIQLGQGELAAVLFKGLLAPVAKTAGPELLHPAIRAVSRNADGMARATLRQLLEQLPADEVRALGPDILVAVQTRCPADTMFGNEIRMGGFKALVRHRFVEGIEAGVDFARTQGGHGSEWRTAEIMKELTAYGTAARPVIPKLQELIVFFDEDAAAGGFPKTLNPRRTEAVAAAIAAISAATTQPELRRFAVAADAAKPPAAPQGL